VTCSCDSTPQANQSFADFTLTFPNFRYISMTNVKFPDFSRCSRWMTTLSLMWWKSLMWYQILPEFGRIVRLCWAEPNVELNRSTCNFKPSCKLVCWSDDMHAYVVCCKIVVLMYRRAVWFELAVMGHSRDNQYSQAVLSFTSWACHLHWPLWWFLESKW